MRVGGEFADRPIRQKLRVIILLISGAAVVGACAVFLSHEWFSSRSALGRQLKIMAEIVGEQSTAVVEFDRPDQAAAILRSLKAERQIVAAALYREDGQFFAAYLREGAPRSSIPTRPGSEGSTLVGGDLLLFHQLRSRGEPVGTFYLRSDMSDAWERLLVDLGVVGLVLLGATGAILFLSARLGGLVTTPMLRLAEVVQAVSNQRNYSIRVEGHSRDELGGLIDGFNDMLSQIEVRDAALAQARDELERRVQERTWELKAANAELEAFSYSVSHDLRAPLRAIDGFSQILLERHSSQIDREGQRLLGVVRDNSRRMGQMIDALLHLSRLERENIAKSPVNMRELVGEVVRDLRALEGSREVDIEIDSLPIVNGDPDLLRQVWQNLVANALKYSRSKPHALIQIGSDHSPTETVFHVRDNGVGFDMQYAGQLFGAFRRLHTQAEFEGTGVGLAIVQRVVQRHGGRVWVDAELGQGATFHFTIPELGV